MEGLRGLARDVNSFILRLNNLVRSDAESVFQDESLPMIRSTLCLSLALVLLPQAAQANDIVDFLKAISGPSPRVQAGHGRPIDTRGRPVANQRVTDRQARLTSPPYGRSARLPSHAVINRRDAAKQRALVKSRANLGRTRTTGLRGSGISFHVSIGNSVPVVHESVARPVLKPLATAPHPVAPLQVAPVPGSPLPALPLPALSQPPVPLPAVPLSSIPLSSIPQPGSFDHLPHQLGQVVTCPVPVFTQVQIKSVDEIAPHAVPTRVAVRDPNLGRFRSCVEQLVYVEVLAPPYPAQRVRVSPCRTRIRLDYGRYEVTIKSGNGVVTVEYND